MISSRLSTPSPVSILAIIITSSRDSTVRTDTMSKAERTKDTARISKDSSRNASRRARSSSVGSRSFRIDVGSDNPGLPMTAPPEVTRATGFEPVLSTSSETPPSPMWILSPRLRASSTPWRSTAMRSAVEVSLKPSTSWISSPTFSVTGVVPKEPARILGPGMSTMMARSGAIARTRRKRSIPDSMSPWAKERRKTSTPAATN